MWHIYTTEYYEKKNEIMSFSGTWMELDASYYPQQTNAETERILHVLTYKWELNGENS